MAELRGGLATLLLGLAIAGAAHAADKPPFKLVRADEDYGALRDVQAPTGLDPLRFIRLDPEGDVYLTLGGEARLRTDALDAARFGVGGEQADSYGLARFLLSGDLHVGPRLRIYGELGLHRDLGKKDAPAPSDRDGLDAQLLFVDLAPDTRWRLRLGRQELQFNAIQRFVSVREGPNIRQAFDGVRATRTDGPLKLDAFYVQPVVAETGAFDDHRNHGQRFYGLYGSARLSSRTTLDLYALGLERDGVRFGATVGDERRTSLGARLAGGAGAFDYEAEAMIQGGRFAGRKIRAWGGSLGGGYTLDRTWSPRLGLRLDAGSGDGDPGDDKLATFNPLFPKGAYFNESGLTSWANLVALRPSVGLSPSKAVSVEFSYLMRRREAGGDAVYLQPLTPLAGSAASTALRVGAAAQADLTWQIDRNLKLQLEAVRQTADDAVTAAGGRDVNYAMAILQARF